MYKIYLMRMPFVRDLLRMLCDQLTYMENQGVELELNRNITICFILE